MSTRIQRKLWIALVAAGLIFPVGGCVSEDATAALAELAASTTGGVVEIIVGDYLASRLPGADDPDLEAPISEQEQ